MPRLVEGISRFFGRVEIFALGLEGERQAAEAALAAGQPLEAREHARTIVGALPDSPLGLALWADAAEDAWLDHEAATALHELAKKVPWRADVWLRLAQAGRRIDWQGVREALERAATAPDERDSARLALLDLADLDLAGGDPARAQRWLDRIPPPLAGSADREVALRRAECAIARGDLAQAKSEVEAGLVEEDALSGREALVKARLALAEGQSSTALDLEIRAFILEADGAGEQLAALLSSQRDVVVVDRVRRVVSAARSLDDPMWAAAFAFAEGRRDDARKALARGLGKGDRSAAAALLALATETRDLDALHALAARDPALLPAPLAAIRDAATVAGEGKEREALDLIDRIGGDLSGWAAGSPRHRPKASPPRPRGPSCSTRSAAARVPSIGWTCSAPRRRSPWSASGRCAWRWWASSTPARAPSSTPCSARTSPPPACCRRPPRSTGWPGRPTRSRAWSSAARPTASSRTPS
jgi:hypothetical protein